MPTISSLPHDLSSTKILFAGFALIMLGACAGGSTQPAPEAPKAPVATPPQAEEEVNDPDSPLIARVVTQTVIEDTPVFPDISRLSGINSASVRALMGDPDLYRRDGNVEIMLFENTHCVLEVILSEENRDNFISKKVSTRTLKGSPTDGGQCLKTLLPGGVFPGS